ncbi:MAG: tetratricopeptide repeat protein [bacterium]
MSWNKMTAAALACAVAVLFQAPGFGGQDTQEPGAASTATVAAPGAAVTEKKWLDSVERYRRLLAADPESIRAGLGLGTALLQLKQYSQAAEVLGPLLKKMPDNAVLQNNMAWIYAVSPDPSVRNPAEAVTLAMKAIVSLSNDADVWNTLAEAHLAAGDFELARRASRIGIAIARETSPERVSEFWEVLRRCDKALEVSAPSPK